MLQFDCSLVSALPEQYKRLETNEHLFWRHMKEIPLTQGFNAIVDDEDYERLSQWKWCFDGRYAVRWGNGGKRVYMHREVSQTPPNMNTDHSNRNKLDNRKHNLRHCLDSQNSMNVSVRKNSASGFKGVQKCVGCDRWAAKISVGKKLIYLGIFKSPVEAAMAYDDAARKYGGEFAKTNF